MTAYARTGANATHLSRAHAPGWAVEVWIDEKEHPITLHRTTSDRSAMLSLYLTEAQARALAHELLHAADVAQQATNTPTR